MGRKQKPSSLASQHQHEGMLYDQGPGPKAQGPIGQLVLPQGVGGWGQFLMLPFRRACHTVGLGMVRRVEQFRFKAGSWYAKIHVGT